MKPICRFETPDTIRPAMGRSVSEKREAINCAGAEKIQLTNTLKLKKT